MYTQVCSFQLVNQACVSEPNSNAKYTICFFFSFLQINILKKTCPFDLEKTHSIERERKKLLGQPLLFHLCFYLSLHDWGTSISSHFFSLSPYSFSLSLSRVDRMDCALHTPRVTSAVTSQACVTWRGHVRPGQKQSLTTSGLSCPVWPNFCHSSTSIHLLGCHVWASGAGGLWGRGGEGRG